MRYIVRAAGPQDLEGLFKLSAHLDSVNLPHDRDALAQLLVQSEQAFSGTQSALGAREYVFVIIDLQSNEPVGTSLVIGQLGRRGHPYIYFSVQKEERYSDTLDKHFVHRVMKTRYSYDGPTEVGGLVVHPDHRRNEHRVGLTISYIRFLWIAMHRSDFRDEVVAELMPPLEPDGTSHLWEAIGRHFTELSYRQADRLSKRNKEFIRSLFPREDIYASILPDKAQEVIGKVGPQTQGVERLLRRIGFKYAKRVDPFDGGPHFICNTDEIALVKDARCAKPEKGIAGAEHFLVGIPRPEPIFFEGALVAADLHGDRLVLSDEDYDALNLKDQDSLWCTPVS